MSMRKIDSVSCNKAANYNMRYVRKSQTLEEFSEYFNFEENCWTSEEVRDEDFFKLDIPLREYDITMKLEFRYGKISEQECFMKKVKIPCDTIENPKVKLNNNLQVLQKYMDRVR
jgi:hypothetical protein